MGSRQRTGRILCVNCNIRVNSSTMRKGYLVIEQSAQIASLISNWISPVIISEEDYICKACFNLAVKAVNSEVNGNTVYDRCAGPSNRGHAEVCLVCGRSLLKRQSHLIRSKATPSDIIGIIETKIAPREILPLDRLCHACFVRTERQSVRNQKVDQTRPADNVQLENADCIEQDGLVATQCQEEHTDAVPSIGGNISEEPLHTESPTPQPNQSKKSSVPNTVLRNYKRAPNTASHCMFYGCQNIFNLHSVSDSLRRILLINHKYYAPIHTKVCSEHLQQNEWDSLYEAENSMSTFTVEQIEHMLSFASMSKPILDFSSITSIEEIDDHLFKHWLRITKDEFKSILHARPKILDAHRGILGLACVIIKNKTKDTDERIAGLLQVPRATLQRLMKKVEEILLQKS